MTVTFCSPLDAQDGNTEDKLFNIWHHSFNSNVHSLSRKHKRVISNRYVLYLLFTIFGHAKQQFGLSIVYSWIRVLMAPINSNWNHLEIFSGMALILLVLDILLKVYKFPAHATRKEFFKSLACSLQTSFFSDMDLATLSISQIFSSFSLICLEQEEFWNQNYSHFVQNQLK